MLITAKKTGLINSVALSYLKGHDEFKTRKITHNRLSKLWNTSVTNRPFVSLNEREFSRYDKLHLILMFTMQNSSFFWYTKVKISHFFYL